MTKNELKDLIKEVLLNETENFQIGDTVVFKNAAAAARGGKFQVLSINNKKAKLKVVTPEKSSGGRFVNDKVSKVGNEFEISTDLVVKPKQSEPPGLKGATVFRIKQEGDKVYIQLYNDTTHQTFDAVLI